MVYSLSIDRLRGILTAGTLAGSVCDEAASVVTDLKAGRATGAMTLRLKGDAMLRLIVLDSIVGGEQDVGGVKSGLTVGGGVDSKSCSAPPARGSAFALSD